MTGTSTTAGALSLAATVGAGTNKPSGFVRFYLDGSTTPSGTPVALTGGKATLNLSGLAAGAHSVVARFTPSLTSYPPRPRRPPRSTSWPPPRLLPAKASTKVSVTFKKSYAKGATIKGTIKVKESAAGKAAGKVVIKLGKKTVGKGTVKNGVATVKITKPLKKGKNKLVALYAGNASFAASKVKFVITIKG